jgi:predicted membrane channel-forming protein YqfA (hemolysin III family)
MYDLADAAKLTLLALTILLILARSRPLAVLGGACAMCAIAVAVADTQIPVLSTTWMVCTAKWVTSVLLTLALLVGGGNLIVRRTPKRTFNQGGCSKRGAR